MSSETNVASHIFREAEVPQPIEKRDNNGWIKWGADNMYPQFLLGLYYNSPIHSGIINSKVQYITSGGLAYDGADVAKWDMIQKNGSSKYTLDELSTYLCKDNELMNEMYIRCVKNIVTGLWQYDILDAELMRNTQDGVYFYYSSCWQGQQSADKTNLKRYKSFENRTPEDLELVLYVSDKSKQYLLENGKLTSNIYPTPTYSGAIVSIMADIEMNNFHFSESVNGFTSGTVFTLLNGVPEDDEKKKIESNLKDSVTDRKKKGGITVLYADGKDREPKVQVLNGNDLDKRYIETQKQISDSTMVAHSVINPSLFGVKTAGQLGSTQELETSYLIFKQNYAIPRGIIITEALTYLNNKLNDLVGVITFNEYSLQFTPSSDITNATGDALNQMSPLLANKVLEQLTINEIRALARLTPIDGGDVIPTATAPTATFSSTDKVLTKLMGCGISQSDLTFVNSKPVDSFDNLEAEEFEFLKINTVEVFANSLNAEDKKILGLINKNVSYSDIVKETKLSSKDVTSRILDLQSKGYIESDGGKLTTSKTGKNEIEGASFQIYYTYELRPDAPKLKGGESREFCRTLLDAKKAFLRTEIENINNDEGTNVWLYRGGWYHNPETDVNQPSCRHFWKMNIVVR